jgi:hypothetical protein
MKICKCGRGCLLYTHRPDGGMRWTCEGCGYSWVEGPSLATIAADAQCELRAHNKTARVDKAAWDAEYTRLHAAWRVAERNFDRAHPGHMGHAFVAPERRG